MASLASSSHRSSSSSFCSSSRYSTSSSYRSEGALTESSDSLGTLFEPFLDSTRLFEDEDPIGSNCLAPFNKHSRASYGPVGSAGSSVKGRLTNAAGSGVRCVGDTYYTSADVSQFEPHDIVVMAYSHNVVIQAQKVLEDGNVSDTFTHKSLFPEDMDPLTVRATLDADGTLLVSVRRRAAQGGGGASGCPHLLSEAHL
ncbi:uncharacterized protein hspb12 [Menidia menidia]